MTGISSANYIKSFGSLHRRLVLTCTVNNFSFESHPGLLTQTTILLRFRFPAKTLYMFVNLAM